MIKRNGIIVALLLVIATSPFFFSHAENRHVFKSLIISFSTHEDNKLWVSSPLFDSKWSVPVGNVSCCWKEVGTAAVVFNKTIPRTAQIEWIVNKSKEKYKAHIKLNKDAYKKAISMPSYVYLPTNKERPKEVYIIFGIDTENNVTAWLSNARNGKNKSNYTIYKIGHAIGNKINM